MFMCFSFCPLPLTLSLHTWEEPDSFSSASHQVLITDGIPVQAFFLEDEQFQLAQPSLVGQICSPLMTSVILRWTYCQHVHVCLVLGSPALDTALQRWLLQCWAEWKDHLPRSAGSSSQCSLGPLGCLCCRGLLLAHVQLAVCQWVLLCKAALSPSMSWCWGWLLPWCRALHLVLLNLVRFPSAHFSSLSRCVWMAEVLSAILYNLKVCWGGSVPSSR